MNKITIEWSETGENYMAVIIDESVKAAIEAVLKRGNDAIIRRKGDKIVVLEEKRKIVYNPSSSRGGGTKNCI